ncbi:sensor domain-containing diguanylate cyclase [Roseixanthobacter glucoisosaccharinicivorans]|uniref:sensor domain-containing diguanylate cyclase n=1 Tax=Roseixanthobacter glucoisosaccharinicivorans TaxID=3119923 RepID=UPI00372B4A40
MFHRLRLRLHHLQDRMTVGQQMAFAMASIGLVTLTAVALTSAGVSRRGLIAHLKAEMAEKATSLADRLDLDLSERYGDILQIADMRPLSRIWEESPDEVRAVIEQLKTARPRYVWIGFANPDGIVLAATGRVLEGTSVLARDWFRNGLNVPSVGDAEEGEQLARLLSLPQVDDTTRFVDVSLPVYSPENRLLGTLGAHLSVKWTKLLSDIAPRNGATTVWLIGRDGRVLLGNSENPKPFSDELIASMMDERSGVFVDKSDGHRVLTGFAVTGRNGDYPSLGWIVVTRQDATMAFADATRLALIILGIGLLALPVTFLGAYWFARKIARPLVTLTQAAAHIGRDPHTNNLPHQRGSLEVLQLSGALRALLRRLGSVEAQIIRSAEQYQQDMEELRQLADTDPLTGLLNRRSFLTVADAALNGSRTSDGLGILMADIDHFKLVNDVYGHPAGDAVIRSVAASIGAALRQHDRVARFGGEEFVVLLLNVDRAGVMALAERMRSAIGSSRVLVEGQEIAVTVSFGAALAQPGDQDVDEVIERADMALYEAKNAGRNRIAVADRRPNPRAA